MLNIKEQAEVFKLGLLIGYFKTEEVIQWADNILATEDNPDLGVIDVAFSGSKGINEVITQLDNFKGKMNISTPVKTLLGLLYKKLIDQKSTVIEITRKLYILSQYIPPNSLDKDIIFRLTAMEDIFHVYGAESVVIQIEDLLKDFEVLANDFRKCIPTQRCNS